MMKNFKVKKKISLQNSKLSSNDAFESTVSFLVKAMPVGRRSLSETQNPGFYMDSLLKNLALSIS